MLLAGLWFGREKPSMTTYMFPLMKELKQLADTGKHVAYMNAIKYSDNVNYCVMQVFL